MSTAETKSHVISIRVSDAEKRKIDMLARKRKRKPSNLVQSYIKKWIENDSLESVNWLENMMQIREEAQKRWIKQRDPQSIIDDIRKFRWDA